MVFCSNRQTGGENKQTHVYLDIEFMTKVALQNSGKTKVFSVSRLCQLDRNLGDGGEKVDP